MSRRLPTLSRIASVGGAMTAALALAACATPTPYKPATGNGYYANGFSDEQIEANRFRVSFSGNSLTSRETVERYLLFRAAQLTLERGYDNFILVDRDTDKKTRTYSTGGSFGGGFGGGYWGPSWRYYGRGFRGWSPWYGGYGGYGFGDPFYDRGFDVRTVEKYEAIAEIVVGRGEKSASNVRAFNAREVIDNLGPRIQVPQQR